MSDNGDALTRPKKSKKQPVVITEAIPPVPAVVAPTPIVEPPAAPVKVKKPRTPAQIAAFEKTAAIRQANIAKIRQNKSVAKAKAVLKTVAPPIEEEESDSSESEVEIVVKKKPKKKSKYTVVVSDSSSDESEPEPVKSVAKPVAKAERKFSSQQNKKSVVKVHNSESRNYDNFFCD